MDVDSTNALQSLLSRLDMETRAPVVDEKLEVFRQQCSIGEPRSVLDNVKEGLGELITQIAGPVLADALTARDAACDEASLRAAEATLSAKWAEIVQAIRQAAKEGRPQL